MPANTATEQGGSVRAWVTSSISETGNPIGSPCLRFGLVRSLRSPIGNHDFAAGNGAKRLVSGRVDVAGEEMHRAVAEQKVRASARMQAVVRVGIEDREVGAGQVRGVGVGEDQ